MSQPASSEQMLTVLDHPLIRTKMTVLRDKHTSPPEFRRTLHEIAGLMSMAAFAHLRTDPVNVDTPLETTEGARLQQPVPCLLSILRAGNGMVDALSALLPEAAIGHLGLQRDPETHKPIYYYEKLPPDIDKRQVVITDPMLATGGSAIMAADHLKAKGCLDLVFVCLISAPEGVAAFHAAHPDIPVITAALDRQLDQNCYILPGLGDAGDRIYNTI